MTFRGSSKWTSSWSFTFVYFIMNCGSNTRDSTNPRKLPQYMSYVI